MRRSLPSGYSIKEGKLIRGLAQHLRPWGTWRSEPEPELGLLRRLVPSVGAGQLDETGISSISSVECGHRSRCIAPPPRRNVALLEENTSAIVQRYLDVLPPLLHFF